MNGTPRNIIIVNDYAFINGGAAKVAIDSAAGLAERGLNVIFFAACGPVDERLRGSKAEVICLGEKDINTESRIKAVLKGIRNRSAEKAFGRLLDRFSPEDTVVHFHGWTKALSASVIRAAQRRGFTRVITLHEYFSVCPNGGFYNYRRQQICILSPMSAACIRCCCDKHSRAQKAWRVFRQFLQDPYVRNDPQTAFLSISEKTESIIRPLVRSGRFYRVYNPVEPAERGTADCTASKTFLYVGRLSPEKSPELFCRAVTDLKAGHDPEGVIVGDGQLYGELRAKYPDVRFEGWKTPEEVREYMGRARALVFPSGWYEGAPLTVIEAMSAGLPCIISDSTAAAEMIEDRVTGLLFRSGNADDLKEKMLLAMDDPFWETIRNNVRARSDFTRYSLRTHIDSLLRVYADLLSRDHPEKDQNE